MCPSSSFLLWAGARNEEEGQAEEKVGGYNQAGLQRNASEVLRCHPDDTEQIGLEEVCGGAADKCRPDIAKALSQVKSRNRGDGTG